MPTKKGDKWHVDMRPEGKYGKRVRKQFLTKAEALRFETHIQSLANKGEWNPAQPDGRHLSQLCQQWYDQHGRNLKDGDSRLRNILAISQKMGDPTANKLTATHFLHYRGQSTLQPKTLNNQLVYLNAVFNELHRTDQIDYPNPLSKVRPIKIAERELSFLTVDQIIELLDVIRDTSHNPHVLLITKICLATGCRWGEAEGLHRRNVKNGTITFTDTKSNKNRTVPIASDLEKEIVNHGEGKLFGGSLTAFNRALARTSITLPRGQAAHALRHSFASHFVMDGGDIVTLQRILGHSSITVTMRYAHLSPEHLKEAIKLNPLAKVDRKRTGE